MTYEDILAQEPFGLPRREKEEIMGRRLFELTRYHQEHCEGYRRILAGLGWQQEDEGGMESLPFLPVRLFKELELASVPRENVFKVVTSSGTSGQAVSRIFLDKGTVANQQKTLIRIVTAFTGDSRMPMLILDSPGVLKNRAMFSARGAGILGFSMFGKKRLYALDEEMNLQVEEIRAFLQEHEGERLLIFGFTFMVWQYLCQALKKRGERLDLSRGILIHGGGWKKLAQEAVSPGVFKDTLREVCGLKEVHDYYGMAEQTGCIYMECEAGHLHASSYSDIIIRRGEDFSPCEVGEWGIIQVLSPLPESYPGHSLLTEDEGTLLGVDDCPCGRKGKYFTVHGRLKQAEIRGCSDTYAAGL